MFPKNKNQTGEIHMQLFEIKDFTTHSGLELSWKIECDALTDEEWDALAQIVAKRFSFKEAIGVPSDNGEKFAAALNRYATDTSNMVLLVDDVLTTGASMNKLLETAFKEREAGNLDSDYWGVVVFSRGTRPYWVMPIFEVGDWLI